MSKVSLIYFLFIFVKQNEGSKCPKELSAEGRLRKDLFCNYDKMVRPVKFFENETLVQFQLYPSKIYMNEHQEVIEFHGNILYVWTDAFLNWDPREYEGLDFIRVSSTEIWVPDISVDTWSQNKISLASSTGADCHLTHTGNIYCFIGTTLEAPCTPDISIYPFDSQNCTLTFSSSGFVGKYINFTLFDPKNGIKMTLYRSNIFWELKEATVKRQVKHLSIDDESTFYPLIKCNFILKRHSAGHAAIIILPAAVLAGLSLLVFWMNTMYAVRVGIAAVVIMSNINYCVYLGFILPSNGDRIPIIVTFFRDSLLIAALSIVVTLFVKYLREKNNSPPTWLLNTLNKMESISFVDFIFFEKKLFKDEDSVEIVENLKKNDSPWNQIATFMDRIFFYLCCFTLVILLVFYLP